jgi:aerobic-type carbon monoxide dehydrogenase small subunit (CoxS/CutS family)
VKIAFTLNGAPAELEIEPRETLAEMLRGRCRLTGVKISCEAQVCGACTVLVDGLPVSACTYLAYEARGKRVITIEGLAESPDKLHPLQQAFLDNFAFQCGFCTPGMILAAKALLDEKPHPTRDEIIAHMDGNLCRCTGYLAIVKSIQQVAGASTQPASGDSKA